MIELIHGDCLDVMRGIQDASIDCVITDPPYGTTACKWDSVIPFELMWEQLKRIAKPKAAICLFGSQPFTSALVMSNPTMYRHEWVWIKNRGSNFANTVREPMKEHESVSVFSDGGWTYNKQMQERTGGGSERIQYGVEFASQSPNYRAFAPKSVAGTVQKGRGSYQSGNYGEFSGRDITLTELRVPSSWQRFNTEVGLHPTQKPVDLVRYLVRTYTNEGGTVLDFTMGSGTTGVACMLEDRSFVGIEKDVGYFEIAQRRIAEAQAKEPLFMESAA